MTDKDPGSAEVPARERAEEYVRRYFGITSRDADAIDKLAEMLSRNEAQGVEEGDEVLVLGEAIRVGRNVSTVRFPAVETAGLSSHVAVVRNEDVRLSRERAPLEPLSVDGDGNDPVPVHAMACATHKGEPVCNCVASGTRAGGSALVAPPEASPEAAPNAGQVCKRCMCACDCCLDRVRSAPRPSEDTDAPEPRQREATAASVPGPSEAQCGQCDQVAGHSGSCTWTAEDLAKVDAEAERIGRDLGLDWAEPSSGQAYPHVTIQSKLAEAVRDLISLVECDTENEPGTDLYTAIRFAERVLAEHDAACPFTSAGPKEKP